MRSVGDWEVFSKVTAIATVYTPHITFYLALFPTSMYYNLFSTLWLDVTLNSLSTQLQQLKRYLWYNVLLHQHTITSILIVVFLVNLS